MILHGLPPVIDARARVLILGSFPSTASLAAQQYYAHPQNQFWRIVGAVIGQPLKDMDYAARLAAAQAAGIAIWDVFASCARAGSLDSAIRDAVPNPLAELKKSAPALRRICFNGRTAAKRIREVEAMGFVAVVLPSTSPAHAGMSFGEKLACWRGGLAS
ncbi:DNA-deoxyinosine glycosylase [Sulfuritalea sp.]|uniref:DNA-deoxyinosine glycosylase n=1 Tax=Sulfuritalea sp. TaxID=2480090 RepID=UPI001AD39A82|nr:DNA-deoxyinosine glycosylase [Sulfuritalea sp.]MBN8476929.1 DNA-deoxyinosine glycosylase [Sulfuritalea sp.]